MAVARGVGFEARSTHAVRLMGWPKAKLSAALNSLDCTVFTTVADETALDCDKSRHVRSDCYSLSFPPPNLFVTSPPCPFPAT